MLGYPAPLGSLAPDQPTHLTPPPPSRPPKIFAPGWGLEFERAAPLATTFHKYLSQVYWRCTKNRFDFTVTLVSMVATIFVYMPNYFNNPILIRMVLIMRLLRLLRMLKNVTPILRIVTVFFRVWPNLLLPLRMLHSFKTSIHS